MFSNYQVSRINVNKPEDWKLLEFVTKLTNDITEVNVCGLLGSNAKVQETYQEISLEEEYQKAGVKYLIMIDKEDNSFLTDNDWIKSSRSLASYRVEYRFILLTSYEGSYKNTNRNLEIITDDIIRGHTLNRQVDSNTSSQFVEITLSNPNGGETFKTKTDLNYYVEGTKESLKDPYNATKPTFLLKKFNILFKIYKNV